MKAFGAFDYNSIKEYYIKGFLDYGWNDTINTSSSILQARR